jgi:PAS domain S-box-containing protein
MKLQLTLTQQIVLLITFPVLVQIGFFVWLTNIVTEVEQAREKESEAVDGLVLVNEVLNDVMAIGAGMFMIKAAKDPTFLMEIEANYARLDAHTEELKRLAARTTDQSSGVKGFAAIIAEVGTTLEQAADFKQEEVWDIESVHISGTIRSLCKRIQVIGERTIEQQNKVRALTRAREQKARAELQSLLRIMTFTNLGMALGLGLIFTMSVGMRFRQLMYNTMSISFGKPLGLPMEGEDELARLDQVVHSLAHDLASTRQQERAMIDNTAEIICSLDESLRFNEVNPAVTVRLGYEQETVRGSLFQSYVHEEDRKTAYDALNRCKTEGKEIEFEARMQGSDGRYRDMELVGRWSNEDQHLFLIIRDVTARKEAERLKQEVIAMVSHDLRAPLSSLGITLDLILEGVAGELNERGHRLVSVGRRSVASLIAIINDLLDIERFESSGFKLDYEDSEPAQMVSDAVNTVLPEAESRKIRLVQECEDVDLVVDKERLRRVLQNLINNAIKFSPDDREIKITCKSGGNGTAGSAAATEAEFRVADHGPGIPEDKRVSVFDKFNQVGTGSEGERKGSGLGLAICKTIVEAHGGRIGIDENEGGGSVFWFVVPKKPHTDTDLFL